MDKKGIYTVWYAAVSNAANEEVLKRKTEDQRGFVHLLVFLLVLFVFNFFLNFLLMGMLQEWRADMGELGYEWNWGACWEIPKESINQQRNYVKKEKIQ